VIAAKKAAPVPKELQRIGPGKETKSGIENKRKCEDAETDPFARRPGLTLTPRREPFYSALKKKEG